MVDIAALVPVARLARFCDAALPEDAGAPMVIEPIGQGRSNLTFRVRRGDATMVLRRPPMGDIPDTAHDVLREHRVLAALEGTPVRAPRLLAVCPDDRVIGAPFYLMEEIPGTVLSHPLPDRFDQHARATVSTEVVDALAELHRLDVAAAGLSDLGRPDGYLARQVQRWSQQWTVMATRELEDIEAVGTWLAAHVPASSGRALVHGDYKLDNVVFTDPPGPRLAAILDWEMATLGDPLADLGYLLVFWPEPGEADLAGLPQPTTAPGFATRDAVIGRYQDQTGRPVRDVPFYRTLALWKLAILTEGLYKRYLAGQTPDDWYAVLERAVPAMAARARQWCGA